MILILVAFFGPLLVGFLLSLLGVEPSAPAEQAQRSSKWAKPTEQEWNYYD